MTTTPLRTTFYAARHTKLGGIWGISLFLPHPQAGLAGAELFITLVLLSQHLSEIFLWGYLSSLLPT